jgi:hypothetical protein
MFKDRSVLVHLTDTSVFAVSKNDQISFKLVTR